MTSELDRQRSAATEGALVQPRPELGTLIVTGSERISWLNGLVTCELAPLKPGSGAYGLAVGKTGKILAELWLLIGKERVAIAVRRDKLAEIRDHFDKHLIMEDAEIADASGTSSWIFAYGPFSAELVNMATARSSEAALVDWTGGRSTALILAAASDADDLARSLVERAGPSGSLATGEAFETLRVAWGVPRFGADFDETTLPQEASLEEVAVSFTKGCYLGQEAVFMLQNRGHAKKLLVRIEVEGAHPPAVGADIAADDGLAVGVVTSAAPFDLATSVCLGFVKYKVAEAREPLEIAGRRAKIIDRASRIAKRT